MKLFPIEVCYWPKLAWVASFTEGEDRLRVCHGSMVETGNGWIAEAVWAGEFARGDFDQTDLVFGTGIRCRDHGIVFVSSGTVFDRLLYCKREKSWYFSNSLPALLAVTDLSLRNDYPDYSRDARSITRGLENRVRKIPTDGEDIISIFYNNLIFNGQSVVEVPKVDTVDTFNSFDEYREFLIQAAKRLGENAASPDRRHPVLPLSSISNGYDSCAAATISRYAGCQDTVTIKDSTSFWRGSDSGAPVAQALGMTCREHERTCKEYPLEEAIWAGEGRPGILNWTQFDYPEPLCLFFTGCHGEKLWDRINRDHPDPFVRRDPSSLGFCEFRLIKGVFQCPLPFWGVRHSQELRAITATEEMKPWYTNRSHDKPIARRIVEETGVPRKAFGTVNKNTSLEQPFWWPLSPDARRRFREYLKEKHVFAPSDFLVALIRRIALLEVLIYRNVLKKLGIPRLPRPWTKIAGRYLVFQWANEELKQTYQQGLREANHEQVSANETSHQ